MYGRGRGPEHRTIVSTIIHFPDESRNPPFPDEFAENPEFAGNIIVFTLTFGLLVETQKGNGPYSVNICPRIFSRCRTIGLICHDQGNAVVSKPSNFQCAEFAEFCWNLRKIWNLRNLRSIFPWLR